MHHLGCAARIRDELRLAFLYELLHQGGGSLGGRETALEHHLMLTTRHRRALETYRALRVEVEMLPDR